MVLSPVKEHIEIVKKINLRGRVSNNLDNPQFLLEKELSFLHLLKSLNLYEG